MQNERPFLVASRTHPPWSVCSLGGIRIDDACLLAAGRYDMEIDSSPKELIAYGQQRENLYDCGKQLDTAGRKGSAGDTELYNLFSCYHSGLFYTDRDTRHE
jgi:hypothetical protein